MKKGGHTNRRPPIFAPRERCGSGPGAARTSMFGMPSESVPFWKRKMGKRREKKGEKEEGSGGKRNQAGGAQNKKNGRRKRAYGQLLIRQGNH